MPTYEYRCKDCEHGFDVVQAFSEPALTECPSCQGRLRKVFGNVGITFKGSGFYKTDSRSSANGKSGKADTGSSNGDSGSKSDSESSSKKDSESSSKKTESSSTKGGDSSTKSASAPA